MLPAYLNTDAYNYYMSYRCVSRCSYVYPMTSSETPKLEDVLKNINCMVDYDSIESSKTKSTAYDILEALPITLNVIGGSVMNYNDSEYVTTYKTNCIICGKQEIKLNQEITCDVKQEDDYVIIEYEPLGIMAYSNDMKSAIECFNEEFEMLYRNYFLEDDNNLTKDAIILKNNISKLIEGVTDIEDRKN